MDNFVAIDFETANFTQSSICSVGIVIVKDGEIVDNFYSLIRPIPNYYNDRCSEVNGMCYDDTCDAQEFPDVWADAQRKIHEYFPFIEDGEVPFVAHNKAFDENCLRAVFAAYDIAYPDYEFECTLLRSRYHCRLLWLRPPKPSPRACRCRSLRSNCTTDIITIWKNLELICD